MLRACEREGGATYVGVPVLQMNLGELPSITLAYCALILSVRAICEKTSRFVGKDIQPSGVTLYLDFACF